MKPITQRLLGAVLLFAGGALMLTMLNQLGDPTAYTLDNDDQTDLSADIGAVDEVTKSTQQLTADITTEERMLAVKQKEREKRVAEQEEKVKAYMAEKEAAEANALKSAREERALYRQNAVEPTTGAEIIENGEKKPVNLDIIDADPEDVVAKQQLTQVEQEKQAAQLLKDNKSIGTITNSTDYQVRPNETLYGLAKRYKVDVAVLAKTNNLSLQTKLLRGQIIQVPKQALATYEANMAAQQESLVKKREAERQAAARQEEKIRQAAAAQKSKAALQAAKQKLAQERQKAKAQDAKGRFGVQVALAANQTLADNVVSELRAAGYQNIKTSPTSRGVRVMVGPEKGKKAALALKDKINSDPKLSTRNAWVLFWR